MPAENEDDDMTLCDLCGREIPEGDASECEGCGVVACCEHLEGGLCPECLP